MSPKKTPKKKALRKVKPTKKNVKKSSIKTKKKVKVVKEKKTSLSKKKEEPKEKLSSSKAKEILLGARKRKSTPSIFKNRAKKTTPIVFTLDDVQEILKDKKADETTKKTTKKTERKDVAKRKIVKQKPEKKRFLGAASLNDILGFNPGDAKSKPSLELDESRVPKKWMKFYHLLLDLRKKVKEGLDLHTQETLKRSSKDDSGDLSGYSQHMADAGTDTFERDFALSLLSNEQDALYEIEEAIQRIFEDNYGVCEITGKPINKDRLMAVPFTRYSLEGQQQLEATKQVNRERGGVFAESSLEESAKYTDDGLDD